MVIGGSGSGDRNPRNDSGDRSMMIGRSGSFDRNPQIDTARSGFVDEDAWMVIDGSGSFDRNPRSTATDGCRIMGMMEMRRGGSQDSGAAPSCCRTM